MFLTIFTAAMITLIGKKIITTCGTIIGGTSLSDVVSASYMSVQKAYPA